LLKYFRSNVIWCPNCRISKLYFKIVIITFLRFLVPLKEPKRFFALGLLFERAPSEMKLFRPVDSDDVPYKLLSLKFT